MSMFMLVQIYLQFLPFNWQNKYEKGKQIKNIFGHLIKIMQIDTKEWFINNNKNKTV